MGGIASALCLLLMMLTIIPIATYTMPALAGMVLIVVENGYSTAWMVYAAVGFLSLFICPDKEAAMLFVGFFGYYPILKGKLEKIKKRSMEYLSKFSIFNLHDINVTHRRANIAHRNCTGNALPILQRVDVVLNCSTVRSKLLNCFQHNIQ